jgi:hypothetical protein
MESYLPSYFNEQGVSFIRKLSNLFSFDGPGKVRIWCSGLLLLSSLLAECPVAVHRALREGPEIRSFLLEKSQSQPPTQLDCAFLSGLTSFTIGLCLLYSDGRDKFSSSLRLNSGGSFY